MLAMWRGLSLANKSLLLLGGAVVLSILATLWLPFIRMNRLVDAGQLEVSRQMAAIWERLDAERASPLWTGPAPAPPLLSVAPEPVEHAGIRARRLSWEQAQAERAASDFLDSSLEALASDPTLGEVFDATWVGITREYRYARAVPQPPRDPSLGVQGVILLERRPLDAARLLAFNSAYLLSAGLVVVALSMLVFYLILHKLILAPVRDLRETAERVSEGDLSIRSAITTGDEFEELSTTFNTMLGDLQRNQDQLRAINTAMDTKLSELAESNVALAQAAKLKGDFLANMSHELRTPLNSIIGFAELLRESAQSEVDAGDDSTRVQKRLRYLDNIATAGNNLMALINDLLEMAKIEAGKATIHPERVNLIESCEALIGLIHPQASRKRLEVVFEKSPDLPIIETDPGKLRQILFNFLSNAVKFTPALDADQRPGRVTLRAERLPRTMADDPPRVRISVLDTGPGIAPQDQARIFEKFQQLDGGRTREHPGTGLGLAISRELAHWLQGDIQIVSELGRGSMFSLILPTKLDHDRLAEYTLEAQFRGTMSSRRTWNTRTSNR
jgi:two-component system, NarL family, sensor histidine kinase BarA